MTYTAKPGYNAIRAVRRCQHPGCTRLTTAELCSVHRPPPAPTAECLVAQQIKDELADTEEQEP
jgi:hypothetical protein